MVSCKFSLKPIQWTLWEPDSARVNCDALGIALSLVTWLLLVITDFIVARVLNGKQDMWDREPGRTRESLWVIMRNQSILPFFRVYGQKFSCVKNGSRLAFSSFSLQTLAVIQLPKPRRIGTLLPGSLRSGWYLRGVAVADSGLDMPWLHRLDRIVSQWVTLSVYIICIYNMY